MKLTWYFHFIHWELCLLYNPVCLTLEADILCHQRLLFFNTRKLRTTFTAEFQCGTNPQPQYEKARGYLVHTNQYKITINCRFISGKKKSLSDHKSSWFEDILQHMTEINTFWFKLGIIYLDDQENILGRIRNAENAWSTDRWHISMGDMAAYETQCWVRVQVKMKSLWNL